MKYTIIAQSPEDIRQAIIKWAEHEAGMRQGHLKILDRKKAKAIEEAKIVTYLFVAKFWAEVEIKTE